MNRRCPTSEVCDVVIYLTQNDAYLGKICLLVGFMKVYPECICERLLVLEYRRLERLKGC